LLRGVEVLLWARAVIVGVALVASAAAIPHASTREPRGGRADVDVLFVGAHPDDEAFNLSTFGRYDEYQDVRTGVVTITLGEGGGNAVGPEEGPALGLIREGEERRAVRRAGIHDVFYLDRVDFYYTVSAPLTESVWGHDATLGTLVRIVRETRPEVIVTMDPSPTPGNHGHHQYAARLAIEAFYAAADTDAYPLQFREGLRV
jgi:LmbE family N-acetylglucosaminyl deacetylase